MKLLLDTHVLIWWLQDDLRLGHKARGMIAEARIEILVSLASPWEISVKHRIGKMAERGADLLAWLEGEGIEVLPLRASHLRVLEALPRFHRDPFDHLIIAQARAEGATIMTDDAIIPRYGVPCIGVA